MNSPVHTVLSNRVLFQEVKKLVAEGRTVTVKVKGRSMTPFLHDGTDSVVLSRCLPDELVRGDIVLASDAAGRVVLHRILKVEGNRLVLMGDGNCRGTETVKKEDVAGIVTGVVRNGHTIDCNTTLWRMLAAMWRMALPVRPYLLAVYRRWRKIMSVNKQKTQ